MDLITLALANSYTNSRVSPGGAGYTEVKESEILPPTVCPLVHDDTLYVAGAYDIPNSSGLGDYEYYLYVDGKEFEWYYNERAGNAWLETDPADTRFTSYYESIRPNSISPETVTAYIKRVDRIIHPIEERYLPEGYPNLPARVSLLEKDGVLLEKAAYTFEVNNGFGILIRGDIPEAAVLSAGTLMVFHLDGVEYERTLVSYNSDLIAGNLSLAYIEFGDTGEPFVFIASQGGDLNETGYVFGAVGEAATHTVGITVGDNSIDPEKLPRGGVGYTAPNTISFTGDLTDKTLVEAYLKLSDEPIDLNDISRIVINLHPLLAEELGYGAVMGFLPDSWTVEDQDFGQTMIIPMLSEGIPAIFSFTSIIEGQNDGFSTGTWGLCDAGDDGSGGVVSYAWISRIEYGEVIHKIDQKYLPPVDSLVLNGADGKQYKLTVDESGALAVTAV